MITEKIRVTGQDADTAAALALAEKTAAYCMLGKKESLHLRLLSEEMMGLLRALTGETDAEFWIESEGKSFRLHLATRTVVGKSKRAGLLSVATSGKNAAAHGVGGMLRDIFERAMEADDFEGLPSSYSLGLMQPIGITGELAGVGVDPVLFSWSMKKYMSGVEEMKNDSEESEQEWDELEKSVVARLADEVSVAIRGERVEMILYKSFPA